MLWRHVRHWLGILTDEELNARDVLERYLVNTRAPLPPASKTATTRPSPGHTPARAPRDP